MYFHGPLACCLEGVELNSHFIQSTLLALLCGSVIGLERQWHRRLVDLKTNALVALGACLFILVTHNGKEFQDFVRMGGQIVVGVGFIGGGLLFREGAQTKGINTAATLWCCAAVGILCGIDRWMEAVFATLTIVSANTMLRQVAQYLNLKMGANDSLTESVQLVLGCKAMDMPSLQNQVLSFCEAHHLEIKSAKWEQDLGMSRLTYTVLFEHARYSHEGQTLVQQWHPVGALSLSWEAV